MDLGLTGFGSKPFKFN